MKFYILNIVKLITNSFDSIISLQIGSGKNHIVKTMLIDTWQMEM